MSYPSPFAATTECNTGGGGSVNLREDVAMAARAAVWAHVAGMWNRVFPEKWRGELLLKDAEFLAHLQTGAIEVHGHVPERRVHPWDCYLNDDHSRAPSHTDCRGFALYPRGAVPAEAVEAALAELGTRARAAGMVVWTTGLIARPAPPDLAGIARGVVRAVRAELSIAGSGVASGSGKLEIRGEPDNAAVLASIDAGNWIAEVRPYPDDPDIPLDITGSEVNALVYSGHAKVEIHRESEEIVVWIYPTRAPRAMRPAFAAAYAKWYGRLAGALLTHRLEVTGV